QSEGYAGVFSQAPGAISEIVKHSGATVNEGDVLLILQNPELGFQVTQTEAELEEAIVAAQNAVGKQGADLEAAKRRVSATQKRLDYLKSVQSQLRLIAPGDGIWVAQGLEAANGAWLNRGAYIGDIVNPENFRFSAVVSQEDASFLFGESVHAQGVRLPGQALKKVEVGAPDIIPAQQRKLPSPALGWSGGGKIAVRTDDRQGTEAAEAFFEFRAVVDTATAKADGVALMHGRSGKIRCTLPPLPLLQQGYRKFRLLLQQRFQI
ncbi:MAG: hypothetical protein KDN22_31630, partial [Verrucomicrobiae bacterium]|nr:hypothetical protein [Verrucomicrobiae bacterium]